VFNLYLTFNINCFVFGGGLVNMGDKLWKPLRATFDKYNAGDTYPVYFRFAELEADAGIIGAAELLNN
jgi:glucokinase